MKTDKLDALLAQSSTPPEDAALFAEMLSLPNDGRYPPVEVEPQLRRQKTLKALRFANRGAGADQSRAGDLRRCALGRSNQPRIVRPDSGPGREPPALDLVRPEFSPPSIGRPHVTELTLHRLAPCDIDFLIERFVGSRSLPTGIRQDIIERTDGIPLFAEEITKAVLDAEGDGDAQRAFAGGPTPVVAVRQACRLR